MNSLELVEEINEDNFYLRKISSKDITFVYESLNIPNLTTYLSIGPFVSTKSAKKLVDMYLQSWNDHSQFNYIIEIREKEGKKIYSKKLGSISIWNISWLHRRAEIGIWIHPNYWKQGFSEKALSLIKVISFNYLKLNRLEAHIAIENEKSINLFKKCGFKEEGILSQYLYLKGRYHNTVILALLNSQ